MSKVLWEWIPNLGFKARDYFLRVVTLKISACEESRYNYQAGFSKSTVIRLYIFASYRSFLTDFSGTNFMLITSVVPKLWLFKIYFCANLPTKCKLENSWDLRSHLKIILYITRLIFRNLILHSTNNRPFFFVFVFCRPSFWLFFQIFHIKFAKFIKNAIRQS